MKLRKKFSISGIFCFFLFLVSALIAIILKKSEFTGLINLFALIFLIASIVLYMTGFIMKKIRHRKRRKRHHHAHSREGRKEMAPYTEEKSLEKPAEEPETEEEESSEQEEHVYQVYTMVPKTPKGKKRSKKKDFLPESGEEAEKDGE